MSRVQLGSDLQAKTFSERFTITLWTFPKRIIKD